MSSATFLPSRWLLVALAALAVAMSAAIGPGRAEAQQVLPCDFSGGGSYAMVSRPPRYDFLPQEVVTLRSALDGVQIQIGIVRPDVPDGVEVPVIVDASPYYHPLRTIDLRACRARLTENFVPQGYAVALVAIRGTGDSGGCMNLFGPKERADLDQAVTWLGERSWSNGAVGMTGLSYDGSTPWMVAAFGNPHLKTIVPASGVPDVFDLLFGGGVPDWRGPSTIINNAYYTESMAFYLPGRSVQSTVEVTACPEYADGNQAAAHSGVTGELDPFGYWQQRRYKQDVEERYRGSILLVQGLQDWNVSPGQQFPWVNEVVERSRRDPGRGITIKYLLGQWGHSMPDGHRPDWADILLRWFDRWLEDDRSVDLGPTAEVQDSAGEWRITDGWPEAGEQTTWWLTAEGELSSNPGETEASRRVAADPFHQHTANRSLDAPEQLRSRCEELTCASFTTEPFAEEFRFSGRPRLRLNVTPYGPGGQLSVYLFSDDGDRLTRLGWGQVDLRFPHGVTRGDPKAEPVEPGEQVLVDFPLQPLDAVVPAGSSLTAVVSQGTAHNRFPAVANYPIDVEVGGTGSALRLNHISPAAGDFFTPLQSPFRPGR